ncbi:MAG: hypothetical protein ABIR80_20260, partial [Opitutaceae bacterium]
MKIPALLRAAPLLVTGLASLIPSPARGAQGTIPAPAAAANAAAQAAGKPAPPMPLMANAPVFPLWAPDSPGFNPKAITDPETYKLT